MLHTIDLSEESERALRRIADEGGQSVDDVLITVAEMALAHDSGKWDARFPQNIQARVAIRSRPEVMGGDACIRDTRIPVWLLVHMKQEGWSDERILANYPGLMAIDLISAWDFYAGHTTQVESERLSHEEAVPVDQSHS